MKKLGACGQKCVACGTSCGRPVLLDLFCGAGGAARGYQLAGFCVLGVDHIPQPRYVGCAFVQADALDFLRGLIRGGNAGRFDLIHASPPCQAYTQATAQWRLEGYDYPDLVAETRRLLLATGRPYVIENVPGAPLVDPVLLDGQLFGQRIARRRLFECSPPIAFVMLPTRPAALKMGRAPAPGDIVQPVGNFAGVEYVRQETGLDWMTRDEIAQAIPPAYTEWIGRKMLEAQR